VLTQHARTPHTCNVFCHSLSTLNARFVFLLLALSFSALELPKRKRATFEPAAAARQDAGHVGFIHLGHTHLCEVFGNATHYGSVIAYKKTFFSVVYDDGHNEFMTGNQLAPLLRIDDAAFADPRRWAFDWTIMTMQVVSYRKSLHMYAVSASAFQRSGST